MALKDAPVQIRRAVTIAQISSSFTRSLGIIFTTLIIATLPTWVPGLLARQTIPVALLILAIGTIIVSNKGSRIREEIAERQFQKARSSTFTTAILGFIVGGILPATTLPLDIRRIPRRPNRRRQNQTRLPSRHDSIPLNPRSTRTRSPRNLPERQSVRALESSASTTRLFDHKRHHRTRSRRHHPHTHTRIIPNKPDGHSRYYTDHDQKRRPRLRRRHNIRSSSLPLLARRRLHPEDILENDQDQQNQRTASREY